FLDHRPRRRRDQCLGAPARHRRGRERARRAPKGLGGRGRRLSARPQGPGHLRLCDAHGRRAAERSAAQGARRLGAQGDRPDRLARSHPVRAQPAEDALGQDHASHPAQDRRGLLPKPRRHVDARRPERRRRPRQQPAEPQDRRRRIGALPMAGGSGALHGWTRRLGSSRLAPYLYVLPALAPLALWNYYPLFFLVDLSFHRLDASSPTPTWVGLANYRELFAAPLFGRVLLNTAIYTGLTVPLSVGLGLALAVALNRRFPGARLFRTLFYTPVVLPTVAAA